MIARLTVQRGTLTEYPLAEKVRGGWQNGVSFYADETVIKVQAGYQHVGALEALLEWLPSHIKTVDVEDVRSALAHNPRWLHLLEAQGRGDDET